MWFLKKSCTKYYFVNSLGSQNNQKKFIKEIELKTKYIIINGKTDYWDPIHKKYPLGLMQIEKLIKYNSLKTRADILVLDTNSNPLILVECKAPSVSIDKDAFFQIAKYNSSLKAKYLFVTNGLVHYCCEMDYASGATNYLKEVPEYSN